MKNKTKVAILFLIIFMLSFRFFFSIDGNMGHNWDWSFPSLSFFFANIKNLSLYAWDSYNLGTPNNLRLVHLPLNLFFSFVGPLVSVKFFLFCLFLSITAISYYGFKWFLDFLTKRSTLNYIPALLYAFSPFLFNDIIGGSWVMWMSYAFCPIYFVLLFKYLTTGSFKYLLLSLLITTFVMISLQNILMVNVLLFAYLVNVLIATGNKIAGDIVKRSLIFFVLLIFIHAYWIVPFISTFFEFTKNTILSDAGVHAFDPIRNSRQSFWNIINLGGYFDRNMYLHTMPPVLRNIFYLTVVFAWLAMVWPLLNERRREEKQKNLFWVGTLLVLIIVVKGGNRPLGGFTLWLYESIPVMKLYRSPQHLMFIPAFIIPVLIAYSMNYFYENSIYRKTVATGFFLIVFIWVGGWWFNGDLGHSTLMSQKRDYVDFFKLPPGLVKYYTQAQYDKSDYRSFFLPAVNSPIYLKTRYQNSVNGYQPEYLYLNKPTFTSEINKFAENVELSFCQSQSFFSYIKYLSLFSVKDIVLRSDIFPHFTDSTRCWNNNRVKNTLESEPAIERFLVGKYTAAYRIKNKYTLEHIYAAPDVNVVAGSVNSLVPMTRTSYLDDYPAMAFTDQQGRDGLHMLLAGEQNVHDSYESPITKKVLFSETNFNDLVMGLVTADLLEKRTASVDSKKKMMARLYRDGSGSIEVEDEGEWEVWLCGKGGAIEQVDHIEIGADKIGIEQTDTYGRCVMAVSTHLEKGEYKIRLINRGKAGGGVETPVRPEMIMISKEKRMEYDELIKSRDVRYLFYSARRGMSAHLARKDRDRTINQRNFYIPTAGEYEVTALIRPKSGSARAHALNDRFEGNKLSGWNLRLTGKEPSKPRMVLQPPANRYSETNGKGNTRFSPVFIFGKNFSLSKSSGFMLEDGMWRWMSNDGSIFFINPLSAPLKVKISLSIASFKKKREVRVALNKKFITTLTLPEPVENVGKKALEEATSIEQLEPACSRPQRIVLKEVVLRPGLNEISLKAVPGPTHTGKDDRYFMSIVVGGDISVRLSGESRESTPWTNRTQFNGNVKDGRLILSDIYGGSGEEMAWVTRKFRKIDLFDYSNFVLTYSLLDRQVQAMDIGFRVDTNGDGKEDEYLTRALPNPVSKLSNRFETDLLEDIWRSRPDTAAGKASLVGVDLFPHKKWGLDMSTIGKGFYVYTINDIRLTSKKGAESLLDTGSFKGSEFNGDIPYRITRDNRDFFANIFLDIAKGWSKYGEFKVPLRGDLLDRGTYIIVPFRISDDEKQNIIPWAGYDTTGDGEADRFVPLGDKAHISNWRLRSRDSKDSISVYQADLPKSFFDKYIAEGSQFKNMILLRDYKPVEPGLDDNAPDISREMFRLSGDKVLINLPNAKDPEDSSYEIYYFSRRMRRNSAEFAGIKEYVLESEKLTENSPGNSAKPVALRFDIEARLPTSKTPVKEDGFFRKLMGSVFSLKKKMPNNIVDMRNYSFNLKAPSYVTAVLPRLEDIPKTINMPRMTLDGKAVNLNEEDSLNGIEGVRFRAGVYLDEGEHFLSVNQKGALEAEIVEIKPIDGGHGTNGHRPQIDFKKLNPTRYLVDVRGAQRPFALVFSENFHKGWKAYVRRLPEGERLKTTQEEAGDTGQEAIGKAEKEPWSALWSAFKDRGDRAEIKDHFVVNGYANGWVVQGQKDKDFQIVIEYKPQRLFEAGVGISITSLIGCIGFLGYGSYRSRRQNNES